MPRAMWVPFDKWPLADRQRWERATTATDFFDDAAPGAHWSAKTRYQARTAYGRWLAFLQQRCRDALAQPLEARVDREVLRAYVEALERRNQPMSLAADLGHLLLALRVLAPESDWSWVRRVQYRFEKAAVPREKRHRMVHPSRLIDLGITLMDGAAGCQRKIDRACQYRDGLLIALLAYRPLRRRSIAELQLDHHLRRTSNGYALVLDGDNTKSGQPIDFPLPSALAPYLTRYLEDYRLLFPHRIDESALWLSAKGGALTADGIYQLVSKRTLVAFGTAISPHLFRDIAATTIAREAPAEIAIARDLLAHAKIETTLQHYTQAQTVAAARALAGAVAQLRASSRGSPRR